MPLENRFFQNIFRKPPQLSCESKKHKVPLLCSGTFASLSIYCLFACFLKAKHKTVRQFPQDFCLFRIQ